MAERRIAHYQITGKLGAGGMGEVFRATDTKLNRDVAIKVLPASLSQDKKKLARFQREAEALASLNHPNIAAIYGLEETADGKALVLELVEGETLAKRLKKGPLPIKETLLVCRQIAEAIEAAHEKGIIHRDLKPGNVMFSRDGNVKVLDFGLAKARSDAPGKTTATGQSDLPTITDYATLPGTVLGTTAYMSPEQARGDEVDERSDIWSFGCVMFECLTGRPVFQGEGVTEILARILEQEIDWSQLQVPAGVRLLLKKCLTKDPKHRLHHIADARVDLETLMAHPASGPESHAETTSARSDRGFWIATALLTGIIALALGWFLKPSSPPPKPLPIRHLATDIEVSPWQTGNGFDLSADGRMLAYYTGSELKVRRLDQLGANVIFTSQNAAIKSVIQPFFDPDKMWIGFNDGQGIKKVAVSGGKQATIAASGGRGATWGREGLIVYASVFGGLKMVSSNGGEPTELTTRKTGESSHRWPCFLPDGKRVLFSAYGQAVKDEGEIHVVDIETGERTLLLKGGTYPRYAPSGHLLYRNRNTLYAVPFDIDRNKISGKSIPVLENIKGREDTGSASYDISDDGTLVYVSGQVRNVEGGKNRSLVWLKPDASEVLATRQRANYGAGAEGQGVARPSLSPDGKRVAVHIRDQDDNLDVWVIDLERDVRTRINYHEGDDMAPVWSHDGRTLAFKSLRDGTSGIYMKASDGTGQSELLVETTSLPDSFSVDGQFVAYSLFDEVSRSTDIWVAPTTGGGGPRVLLDNPFNEWECRFSPKGDLVAFTSTQSGRHEVFLRSYPDLGNPLQLSLKGGSSPRWSSDGSRLFYRRGERIVAVTVARTGGAWQVGDPEEVAVVSRDFIGGYDVLPDGSVLMIRKELEELGEESNTLNIIFNWAAELTRNVPVD